MESAIFYTGPIITLDEARASGLTRYFTGKPCKSGHLAQFMTSNRTCIVCNRISRQAWISENREKRRAAQRANYAANRERNRAKRRAHYAANRDKLLEESRAYRAANRERYLFHKKIYRERHAEKARKSRDEWARRNKDRTSLSRKKYLARIADTPRWLINSRMSHAIRRGLVNGKEGASWIDLVPYSLSELVSHIERQFTKGMGWHNRSRWHIDHITPLASFKFTSAHDPEFKAAWALTNLRPLWARKNARKWCKRTLLL